MFERKFGGWSFEIKNDSTLESGNRLHFRYLSKTMPLFRGDSSLYSPCTRGRSETSFDFLSFSLSTLKPFHPIGRAKSLAGPGKFVSKTNETFRRDVLRGCDTRTALLREQHKTCG